MDKKLLYYAGMGSVIANGIELMGLVERVTIYTYLLWIFVLVYKLIYEEGHPKGKVAVNVV